VAVQNGFGRYDTKSGVLEMLATVEHENSSIRFNDGKCDPAGRFWAGTMAQDGTPDAGSLYCLDYDLIVTKKLGGIGISNGIGWSPKADKMYYIDSRSQKVVEYSYDLASGAISSPRTVVEIEVKEGTPDGMCVDAEGMLWVALWDGGKVIRINPKNGERLSEVMVPKVQKVTSCAFGGKDLSTLFITTARVDLSPDEERRQPDAGSLFSVVVGVRGLPANVFELRRCVL
ncbi:MAG: SMP-30/gluconolactonase/LRE family protein, partial [Candidatus Kaiserbacteria bacterium]|nr:SMP-30/gluconolactonase/LRE family protein [Candidatus Kaiserbacteria bacterium]